MISPDLERKTWITYEALYQELIGSFNITYGEFSELINTPPNLSLAFDPSEETHFFKLTAISKEHNVFIKAFAPCAAAYAAAYFNCFSKLSSLDLSIPTLPSLQMIKTGIFFPLGEKARQILIRDIFSSSELKQISDISQNFGLKSISGRSEYITLVSINNRTYATDIIDDSVWKISQYLDRDSS